jgi:DNA repair exonuclease SbcCD ATPase subunit
LKRLSGEIAKARATEEEKEQALKTAQDAKAAMEQFRDAGADRLTAAQADQGRQATFLDAVGEIGEALSSLNERAARLAAPAVDCLGPTQDLPELDTIASGADQFRNALTTATKVWTQLDETAKSLSAAVDKSCTEIRASVQRSLVEKGRKAEDLGQFDALSKIAAKYESARQQYDQAHAEVESAESKFRDVESKRAVLLDEHRNALEKIMESVNGTIASIRVSLSRASDRAPLEDWIKRLREAGITRWWNDNLLADPKSLYQKLEDDRLADVGMSAAVASRFKEVATIDRRFQLRSIRSEDECRIEALVDSKGTYRPIEKLSGGKQISVVLSLLLESSDDSPLVIDQPEDELDKIFLAETLLPILRRLKGRRQIIFATHDANIVVNGDADQVILLDATSDAADVKAQGAIDHPVIRDAILKVLDGGPEAFDMRSRRYGF